MRPAFVSPFGRRALPGPRQPLRVYLAGKITKDDWRAAFLGHRPGALSAEEWLSDWPVLQRAVLDAHDYVGPYFIGCDHGCAHGANTHGASAAPVDANAGVGGDPNDEEAAGAYPYDVFDCAGQNTPTGQRADIFACCMGAIDRADVLFAWLASGDCHGTLVEIGHARARGVKVLLGYPPGLDTRDLWFPLEAADHRFEAPTPVEAFHATLRALRAEQANARSRRRY